MKKCTKCRILLDINDNRCPLCYSEINDQTNFQSSYPNVNAGINKHLFRKLMFLLVCLVSIAAIVINYLLTPNIKWSIFVIMQIILSYYVFYNILSGTKNVIKLLLVLNIIICFISVFWDIYTGFHAWSTNYVFPSLAITYGIFMLILRLVDYFAFRENSSYIYLNICLEFIPIILAYLNIADYNALTYLSCAFGILNLLILIIFDSSTLKEDILKKMHF